MFVGCLGVVVKVLTVVEVVMVVVAVVVVVVIIFAIDVKCLSDTREPVEQNCKCLTGPQNLSILSSVFAG